MAKRLSCPVVEPRRARARRYPADAVTEAVDRARLEKEGAMTAGAYTALDASVLVLNKMFMAVHVISVRRAFCLLCKDLAEVVSLEDGQFATYDFATWRELSEYRAQHFRQEEDDWVRTATTRDPGAARDSPAELRQAAEADGEVQPPEHLRPRQQPVPVLRQEVPDERTEPRPRRAAQPGRRERRGRTSSAPAWTATSARAAARRGRRT